MEKRKSVIFREEGSGPEVSLQWGAKHEVLQDPELLSNMNTSLPPESLVAGRAKTQSQILEPLMALELKGEAHITQELKIL